jgi:hypothetical protein
MLIGLGLPTNRGPVLSQRSAFEVKGRPTLLALQTMAELTRYQVVAEVAVICLGLVASNLPYDFVILWRKRVVVAFVP